MKKINITVICLFLVCYLFAQNTSKNNLNLIQGIWADYVLDREIHYSIVKGKKSLDFSHVLSINKVFLSESIIGFQNLKKSEIDSLNVRTLKSEGAYFTIIIDSSKIRKNGFIPISYCIIPEYFKCDNDFFSYNGGQISEFHKIKELPSSVIKLLYLQGKNDHRDYLKEFLNKTIKVVKVKKATIHSSSEIATKMYLIKNDVVEILEEKGDWLLINYYPEKDGKETGKTIEGWIKKSDVE